MQPVLYVRRPGDDHEEVHRFADDDPFFHEVSGSQLHVNLTLNGVQISNFIDVIEDVEEKSDSLILSSYEGGLASSNNKPPSTNS